MRARFNLRPNPDMGSREVVYTVHSSLELFDRMIKLRGRSKLFSITVATRRSRYNYLELATIDTSRYTGKVRFSENDLTDLDRLEQLAVKVWDAYLSVRSLV